MFTFPMSLEKRKLEGMRMGFLEMIENELIFVQIIELVFKSLGLFKAKKQQV